jgi:hypothetical protein
MPKIEIIYMPGSFGNLLRFIIDRSLPDSKLKNIDSPFTKGNNVHQTEDWSPLLVMSRHGVPWLEKYPEIIKKYPEFFTETFHGHDLVTGKIIITVDPIDEIFIHRSNFYRTLVFFGKSKIDDLIKFADTTFVNNCFKNNEESEMVAKELKKIEFYTDDHIFKKEFDLLLSKSSDYKFNMRSLFDAKLLCEELKKINNFFNLELQIDELYLTELVKKIKKITPVDTIDRWQKVYNAIKNKENISCVELDIIEQAWIEVLLEKEYDCVLFPFGTNWFSTTKQINEFLDRYPSYLKQMNPRLPWYNNNKNPFYIKAKL